MYILETRNTKYKLTSIYAPNFLHCSTFSLGPQNKIQQIKKTLTLNELVTTETNSGVTTAN